MELIDRVGVVIPGGSTDPAADARRLEALGFRHALLPHETPAAVLMALGATRTLRLVTGAETFDLTCSTPSMPTGALDRLAIHDVSDKPLTIDPTDVCRARTEIAGRLGAPGNVTVDVVGPHTSGVHALALRVLAPDLPGRTAPVVYAEDLAVGQVFDLGDYPLTQDEIVSFAERFDPLDFHIDPDLASASPLGLLCASGVHTQAIMQRLSARGLHRRLAVVAGRGMLGMRLWKPVTPGLTLHGSTEVLDVQMRTNGRAIVTVRSTLHASGDLVLEQTGELVVQTKTQEHQQ